LYRHYSARGSKAKRKLSRLSSLETVGAVECSRGEEVKTKNVRLTPAHRHATPAEERGKEERKHKIKEKKKDSYEGFSSTRMLIQGHRNTDGNEFPGQGAHQNVIISPPTR